MTPEELVEDRNYTVAKFVGEPKVYGDKTRFAFTTNETGGDMVLSLFTKFPENVKVGASLWGHIEVQEKDGRTYHNFFFGKNNPNRKGGLSDSDKASIVQAIRTANAAETRVKMLETRLIDEGILKEKLSDGSDAPDFGPEKEKVDAEWESLEASAAAAMR